MLENLMTKKVDWLRPKIGVDANSAEYAKDYETKQNSVPVSIQPLGSQEQEMLRYLRGTEITHNIFTTTIKDYQKNDRLLLGERVFVITGAINLIEANRVIQMECREYPSAGKKR